MFRKSVITRGFCSGLKTLCFGRDELQLRVNFRYPLSTNKRRKEEGKLEKCAATCAEKVLTDSGVGSNLRINATELPSNLKGREDQEHDCAFISEDLMTIDRETVTSLSRKPNWKRNAVKRSAHSTVISGEVIFGISPVKIALRMRRRRVHQLFVKHNANKVFNERIAQIEEMAKENGIPVVKVPVGTLDRLSEGRPHQGVCLDASTLNFELLPVESYQNAVSHSENSADDSQLWILLDKLQDPMNMGAVLRSSYYFGVDRVLTVRDKTCKLTPVVSKASSGAMEILTVYQVHHPVKLLSEMVKDGWCVIGSAAERASNHSSLSRDKMVSDLRNFLWPNRTVFLIGNEGDGVESELLELCDKIIVLPSRPQLDSDMQSLNVSVATGIILSSYCMQNLKDKKSFKK